MIVCSYVDANKIAPAEVPALITSTYAALERALRPADDSIEPLARPTAAQIRKSIKPDGLISFVDGRPYSMLKRHLAKAGMTPADYRGRYGLPKDYPMTAPSYSAKRSALALSYGLGRPAPAAVPPEASKKGAKTHRTSAGLETAGPGARVPKAARSVRVRKDAQT